jgi:hypothetical protein
VVPFADKAAKTKLTDALRSVAITSAPFKLLIPFIVAFFFFISIFSENFTHLQK